MRKRKATVLDEILAEKLQRAEQNCQTATQEFYDELCRASEHQAAREGIELGSFATLFARGAARAQNLFVVVGFGPVVYHGLHNYPTRNSPDGAWSAWVRGGLTNWPVHPRHKPVPLVQRRAPNAIPALPWEQESQAGQAVG
jgi:hypothetical protein